MLKAALCNLWNSESLYNFPSPQTIRDGNKYNAHDRVRTHLCRLEVMTGLFGFKRRDHWNKREDYGQHLIIDDQKRYNSACASVSRAIKRLRQRELIEDEWHFRLTDAGLREAERLTGTTDQHRWFLDLLTENAERWQKCADEMQARVARKPVTVK